MARMRRHEAAVDNLHRAVEVYGELGDECGRARTRMHLGVTLQAAGRPADALARTREALAWFRSEGDRAGEAYALAAAGWYLALLPDHEQALVYCGQAAELLAGLAGLSDRYAEAAIWCKLTALHHQLGDRVAAIDGYRRTVRLTGELGDLQHQAEAQDRIGDLHAERGDLDQARAAWSAALRTLTSLGSQEIDEVRTKLATSAH
jgi:tetratricopeptide (TPR) repeat protein